MTDPVYVLEYNSEQEDYHVQSMQARMSLSAKVNVDWEIVYAGSWNECVEEMRKLKND